MHGKQESAIIKRFYRSLKKYAQIRKKRTSSAAA